MAKKTLKIELESDLYDVGTDGATIEGTTLPELVEKGQTPQNVVNNHLNQALWRLLNRGVIPAELAAEVKAEAARVVAAKTPAAGAQA